MLLSVGTTVRVQYEYQNNLKDIDEVVGYKSDVLIDGEPFFDATEGYGMDRLPRTIMGKKANGNIAMIVVDGRQPAKGYFGANQGELAAIALHYGLVSAYQFDGGGSSTMIIRKDDELTVVNSPSDGMERSDSDCLLVVARVPALEYTIERDSNSITFHVNILDNLIKYQDLFIEINDEKKKIVNGEVVFSSLKTYEFYRYYFYGYDGKDYTNIIYSGVINTTKEIPIIENVIVNTIYDQNNLPQYEVKCVVKDPNQALESITIVVGKKIYQINNDVFLIPYEETELLQKDGMFIRIRFNIGDEIMTHVENITSFNLEVKSSTTLLEELKQKINKQINNCY